MSEILLTEVPSNLKQLARLVVRGFYTIEDALIIDMLVRNPCMKEDDICDLLKFERKMLRARIATLKNDKFIQTRLKMETGPDGKAQKVNYYFINYKTFVNVVKYKLDHMRKRLETEERDATSRASFKCEECKKSFTDLQADQLFDFMTGEFRCTFCGGSVEEDQAALPKKDSRLLLAKFNEQLEPLYILLREVEDIKLAPEVLEPEPTDITNLRKPGEKAKPRHFGDHSDWTDPSKARGFEPEETRLQISFGEDNRNFQPHKKELPTWITESTVNQEPEPIIPSEPVIPKEFVPAVRTESEETMLLLLAHEKKGGSSTTKPVIPGQSDSGSDTSEDEEPMKEDMFTGMGVDTGEVGVMDSEEDDHLPTVLIGDSKVPVTDINDELIAKMTPAEKEAYIQVYQEYYSHMYD